MIAVHTVAAVGVNAVETVGAYAGLAAVVGLGVLSLLYFSQAREVKRLREWAGRAPERALELEQRVQVDAQRRVVAQPVAPATVAAQNDAARQAAAAAELYAKLPPPPPAPAPLVGPPGQLARPGTPAAGSTTAGLQTVSDAPLQPPPAPAPGAGATPGAVPDAPASAPSAAATAAATAAARRAAVASRTVSPPPTVNGAGQDTRESEAARPSPLPEAARPSLPSLPALPEAPAADGDDGGFSLARIAAIIGGAVVVVLIGVALMITLTDEAPKPKPNDFGTSTQAATPIQESPAMRSTPSASGSGARVDRGSIKIAVLNGTRQTGLARGVADKLGESGFTIGTVGNNTVQQVAQTIVSFTAGNERAAQMVAGLIKVDRSSVQPIARTTSVMADADVVVTVGTDLIG